MKAFIGRTSGGHTIWSITSYRLAATGHFGVCREPDWRFVILDEGRRNDQEWPFNARQTKAAKAPGEPERRIALTGTPVENHGLGRPVVDLIEFHQPGPVGQRSNNSDAATIKYPLSSGTR